MTTRERATWHAHPSAHVIGGNLGIPDPPKAAFPGSRYRKGTSGNPAASDHSHPLEAVRMNVVTAPVQGFRSLSEPTFRLWGNPGFAFVFTPKDTSCDLYFQYITTFYVNQAAASAVFGIWYAGTTYYVGQYDNPAAIKGIHYKNTPLDHTLAMGIIKIPAGIVPDEESNFYFMWQRYNGAGEIIVDGNDFAQIIIMESYAP